MDQPGRFFALTKKDVKNEIMSLNMHLKVLGWKERRKKATKKERGIVEESSGSG